MEWYWVLIIGIAALIVGGILGFIIAVSYFKNYQKKNPPITKAQIKVMMQQMGRPASEKQVNQVYQAMINTK